MNLDELKKRREENFSAYKKKKKIYYQKTKITVKKEIDYEKEINDENFSLKIKELVKAQKKYLDNRKDLITLKINEYRDTKKEYYEQNKEKRL